MYNRLKVVCNFSGKNRNLVTIDKKLIQLRLGQSKGDATQNVYHEVFENTTGCTVFDTLVYGDAVYLCIGKTDKITIMKYNSDLRKFCVRKVILIDLVLDPLFFQGCFPSYSSISSDLGHYALVLQFSDLTDLLKLPDFWYNNKKTYMYTFYSLS